MSSIINKLITFCNDEWDFFGKGEINLNGTTKEGIKEYQDGAWQRIGDYWKFIDGPYKNLTGKDRGTAWSAAFISFAFSESDAGEHFPYSAGHAKYINTSIRNSNNGKYNAPIVGQRLASYKLKPGDLIGYWRGDKKITFDNARKIGWYKSHTEIIVEVGNQYAYSIGGNVNHTVIRRQVKLNKKGEFVDKRENWFVIIQNNM